MSLFQFRTLSLQLFFICGICQVFNSNSTFTISVVFTLFGHCLNTKICQFSFQNLGFSFPESHQVDIFQGMTQNFTPHINLITTKTPAITLLYTLLLSPISLLGNQAQLASAHSLAPLHNISSLSLSRVFAD